jgi:hypothetical protein
MACHIRMHYAVWLDSKKDVICVNSVDYTNYTIFQNIWWPAIAGKLKDFCRDFRCYPI